MAPDNTSGTDPYVLGQIDAKVSHLLEAGRTHRDELRRITEDMNKRIDRHDVRITKVEHSAWKITGIATALPVALTTVGLALKYIIGG